MNIRATSTMILSQLKRALTSASLKIALASIFFLLALASTATGGLFHGWYIFEPFFLTLHGSLFVLASVAFLIAAARQVLRNLFREQPAGFEGEPAIPGNFDASVTKWYYYPLPQWRIESQPVYEPIIPTGIDSV